MKAHSSRPKIAVIGSGWAGLSAAVQLASRADISLFEAGKIAGGRARTLAKSSPDFRFLDNGQHIMIGAYHSVLSLMKKVGVNEQDALLRLPLQWHMHQQLQFQMASLPAPLHILVGLLWAKNISFTQKMKLLRDMQALQKRHKKQLADISIAQWLRSRNVPRKLIAEFWQPLVLGALNTPLTTASLNTLCNVLSDGVWANKSGSDYLLPKQDLGKIMAEPALNCLRQHGAHIHLETRVPQLETLANGKVRVNQEIFDAVILAVAPYHAAALMPSETPDYIYHFYHNMAYHSITTVYLRYRETVQLPAVMTGLSDGTAQWLIQRSALGLASNEIAAVISVSDQVPPLKPNEYICQVHQDLLRICPDLGEPLSSRVITEKRATIAATANRNQADFAWLNHHKIYPAGDYLHPRYPATLEAAVQSGITAADLCWTELHQSMP